MADFRQHIKNAGQTIGCLFGMVALFVLSALLLKGMVWISDKALPWLMTASIFTLAICVLVLLPLALFRKTRGWAGNGYYIASFVFGTMLFAYSCIVAYEIWGYRGLIFGLLLAGVGVLPVAILATVFHAYWPTLGDLALVTVLTFGTRAFGIYLLSKVGAQEEDQEPYSTDESDS